jgi:hypothetical protein
MKTILKIAIGVIVAVVVLIILLVVLLGAGAHQAQKDNDKTAITLKQFHSIKKGADMDDVIGTLGKPQDKQHQEIDGMPDSDCIYYNKKGEFLGTYQFCFDNDILTSKSAY